jgi:hypothetical protein
MPNDGVDGYTKHAANCIRLAQETNDTDSKLSLLDMARAWLALAEQGERNRDIETAMTGLASVVGQA